MFTVNYGTLRDEGFNQAMMKLNNTTALGNAKLAYDIGQIVKEFADAGARIMPEFQKIVAKHAAKDSAGKFVMHDGKPGTFSIPREKQEEWNKEIQAFDNQTFSIHRHKLEINLLSPCNFSPAEITALSPILLLPEGPNLKSVS